MAQIRKSMKRSTNAVITGYVKGTYKAPADSTRSTTLQTEFEVKSLLADKERAFPVRELYEEE